MRNLSYVLFLFIIIGCDSESLSVSYEEQVSTTLNKNPEVNPLESTSLFYQDLSYGSAERNTFDLMIPKDGGAIGIVIFFMEVVFCLMTKRMLTKNLLQVL